MQPSSYCNHEITYWELHNSILMCSYSSMLSLFCSPQTGSVKRQPAQQQFHKCFQSGPVQQPGSVQQQISTDTKQRLHHIPHGPQGLGSLQGPPAQAPSGQGGRLHGRGRRPSDTAQQQLHFLHYGHHRHARRFQAERRRPTSWRGCRQRVWQPGQEAGAYGQLHKLLQRRGRAHNSSSSGWGWRDAGHREGGLR